MINLIGPIFYVGAVAIDDITVQHESCQPADPNVFRCTFEGGHNCSFASIYVPTKVGVIWEIYQGSQTYIKTVDHTLKTQLGHFYAMDFHNISGYATYNYLIISQFFRPTAQSCVTFSYFMNGLIMNESITFYIVNSTIYLNEAKPLWTASGDLGPFWYSHRITISSNIKWRIEFGAETYTSNRGLIAIDDVIVQLDKACPPKGFCDFEVA